MSTSLRRLSAVLVVPAALLMSVPTPASADPTRHVIAAAATCSDGNTYDVVVPGNGYYLPALVTGSTQVHKPVAFGKFTFTVRDPEGAVVFVGTDPATEQGGGNVLARNPKTYIECTVSFTAPLEDGFTVTVDGSVTGFLTPAAPR
ncbi:hypothetical protein [Nocardioides speluncae]|uniref:hypothetical protein n=1 Tax=Nocardioides speluncae TaxID=2670337 RepID=UPI000D688CDC|nr:hypothetical protein [Nocardioides speluncae]